MQESGIMVGGSERETVGEAGLQRFAVGVYGADGASTACLLLQASAGVDVNLVLFAAFDAARGVALTAERLAEARERVDSWHTEVVQPLRAVRQRLKSGPLPAPDGRTAALRAEIRKLEIEAEFVELAELEVFASGIGKDTSGDDDSSSNADFYAIPKGPFARAAVAEAVALVVRQKTGRHPYQHENDAITRIAVAAADFDGGVNQVSR